jgi:cysteine-rich repeat protein
MKTQRSWIIGAGVVVAFGATTVQAHIPVGGRTFEPGSELVDQTKPRLPEGLSASDWDGIRSAYEAHRHAVVPDGDGHAASNPGQQWRTRFDGRGFTTRPNSGGWQWGLQLVSYGSEEKERTVTLPQGVEVEAHRLAYQWDDALSEWYVNDPRGLEHGFTVSRRPYLGAGPLRLCLAVRGELSARVVGQGREVAFTGANGAGVVNYSGLAVYDADGATLPARFEAIPGGLRLVVEDNGARYPLTIDPIAQQAYLKASNADVLDYFGISVAISGDTVVVGALGEDSAATGVNGDQSDNSAIHSGAAYVFVRSGTTWSQQAYLKASNTDADDGFGYAVGISGDTVVVGAYGEASAATGVNGNQSDNSASSSGAAYVFVRSGTTWSQQAYLKASNSDAYDIFGAWVGIADDTVVVGASFEDSAATGVNGNQSDNSASYSGAAYVFVRSATTWSQQAYLKASNTDANDYFGYAAGVSGDTVVVGARGEASAATGVNGNQSDNSASSSGAAYVFVRSGTTWSQQAYLKASNSDAYDIFGAWVGIADDTVVVGASFEDSAATGVNGNQSDNSASYSGAAYVFVRSATTWSQQAYLKASNADANDYFGHAVAISGDTVVVGAYGEASAATGVNSDQSDNSAPYSGAAYVFVRSGTTWSQQAYLKASNTEAGDYFGSTAGISGDTVVVGAFYEASAATGVNGDQSDNSAYASGAAYVFLISPAVCGDGVLEDTEQCDDGNTMEGDCCSSTCQFESSATECRPAAGVCDVAEFCTGASATCPSNGFRPSGFPCRASTGPCDPAENCTGSGANCPADTGLITACMTGDGCCPAACTRNQDQDCPPSAIPTVSEWGLAVLTLIGLAAGTILFGRSPKTAQ